MSLPAAVGPYSLAVRAGGLLFCSGQIGVLNGQLVDGVEGQTRQVFANIRAVLESEGLTLANVIKATVFMADIADYDAINQIYADEFGDTRPARSAVEVAALPRGARIEIEVIAKDA